MKSRSAGRATPPAAVPAEESALFREAVQDAAPLPDCGRVLPPPRRPSPVPRQTLMDERQALHDSLSDYIPAEEIEADAEPSYLRPGLPRQILRKLRGGHWVIQDELDLHGLTSPEARLETASFLDQCKKRGVRCVRIIHGKGLRSKNREPVLKSKVRHWLMQRDEVLAFCEARPVDGGGGALLALLKAS